MNHHELIIAFLLLAFLHSSSIGDKFATHPYFGDAETDIIVQQGEAAFFNCHVFNLANQTVSWMRKYDGYPLFIGHVKYISDQRFELVSRRRGQNTLKLKFTNASDAGNFECQVSTNPKISQVFKLTVVVPSVSVEGQQEKHVMAGSPVQLKCYIKNCLKQPSYVFWRKTCRTSSRTNKWNHVSSPKIFFSFTDRIHIFHTKAHFHGLVKVCEVAETQ